MDIVRHVQIPNTTLLNIVIIALPIVKHVRQVKQTVHHVLQENTYKQMNVCLVKLHVLSANLKIYVLNVIQDIGLITKLVLNAIINVKHAHLKLNAKLVLMAIT